MPEARLPLVYLVAGESSGDQLGAELMHALRAKLKGAIDFKGVGGPQMQLEGIKPLFPSSDIAVMWPTMIIRNFPLLVQRLSQTVADIVASKPDALVVIDSPEFTQRVAKRVRKVMPEIAIIKYVAPQVWAWRPKRAVKMKSYIDEILALLPFEPDCYERLHGPKTTYVGHPLITRSDLYALKPEDQKAREDQIPTLALLPGSRSNEVKRLLRPFGETLELLHDSQVFHAAIPAVPHLRSLIEHEIADWKIKPALIEGEAAKWALFRRAKAALAASGTVTLELALAQVPTVVAYKVEPWMVPILRHLIKVNSIVLPNLIAGTKFMPEFYQDDVRAEVLAPQLHMLMNDQDARKAQADGFAKLLKLMQLPDGKKPAEAAAERVLARIKSYFLEATGT